MAKRTFDAALKAFKKLIKDSMDAARECAHLSIEQFAEHGNLRNAQEFYEAMPKNYARRNAFALWLVNYAPVKLQSDGKFVKDQDRADMDMDLDAARAKDFWDYAPDPTRSAYTADDVVTAVKRTIKRFKNEKKYEGPADEAATETLQKIEAVVA